jgi:glycosyltransferase involved in cell wall biosynthesis
MSTSLAPLRNHESASRPNVPVALTTKRVLVISFDFPPHRTSAVYRMTGLVSHLPQFGWQPTVLTTQVREGDQEPELLEKLPRQVHIERTRYRFVGGWENTAADAVRRLGALSSTPADSRQSPLDRCLRFAGDLVRSVVYFPDDTVGWIPYGLSRAVELHRKEPFDLVYTTTPPRAAPVIGLLLKVFERIPWVSEFMDPWVPAKGRVRRWSENWLQARLMAKADRVVVMVPQHTDELTGWLKLPRAKFSVVRNGFFEEDFTPTNEAQKSPLDPHFFNLSHFGTVYPERTGKFVSTLAALLRECPDLRQRLRLNIIGYPSESILRLANQKEMEGVIQFHGFIQDRKQVLQMMRDSDCLLLFWGDPYLSRLTVAGKTYDYLRVGRPILAVTHEGGVKQLVEEGGAGWVVSPDDPDQIKQTLKRILSEHRNDGLPVPPRPEFVAQFRWDYLARSLASVFDKAIEKQR